MWSEGRTAGEIAVFLGGVTRDAVCGKLNRLGLIGTDRVRAEPSIPSRPSIAARSSLDESGAPTGRPRHSKTRQTAPALDDTPRPQAGKRAARKERAPCRIAMVPMGFAPSLPEHRAPAQTGLVSSMAETVQAGHDIMTMPLSRCRWPVNDAKRPDGHLFCGEKNAPGKMYCPRHAARSVEPSSKRKGGDA